jgi:penicillin-binding protein 1A
MLGLGLTFVLVLIAWVSTCGFYGCPSTAQIQAFRPSEGSRVLDRSGTLIGRLTYVRRINLGVNSVPRSVRAAFVATEDRRFYYHGGVDWRSAGRALARNLSAIGVREGFSTITMQVVRNAFLPHLSNERSLRRKLIELELGRARNPHTGSRHPAAGFAFYLQGRDRRSGGGAGPPHR